MFVRLNKYLLLLAGGGVLITPATAMEPMSPLLQTLEKLECAADARAAHSILDKLFNVSPPGQEWPDEWLGEKPDSPALYAGTLDIALSTLKSTAERFPELREDSERVALQWNYCDVLEDQHFQNLLLKHDIVQRVAAADDAPLKWAGFRQWGFLTPDPRGRFVPLLLDEIRLAPHAYQLFLHRAYRQRCFPHPETGLLASEADAPAESVLLRSIPEEIGVAELSPYPFNWAPFCRVVKKEPPLEKVAEQGKARKKKTVVADAAEKKPQEPVPAVMNLAQTEPVIPVLPQSPGTDSSVLGAKGNEGEALNLDIPLEELVKRSSPPAGRVVLPTIAQTTPDGVIPIFYEEEELETMEKETPDGKQADKKKKLQLAGSVSDSISLSDGSNTLSASVTWAPKKNWFVTGNVSSRDGQPGYSWSAGYVEWKPGTWSAQINNWGPLKPGEGLAVDKAIANVGYKFKSATLEEHKLATSTNLGIPLGGNKPSLSGTLQWNPEKNWYARATASVPVEGGSANWTYAFGYADYRPGKWRVEYSNYGTNAFPGDNFKNGSITISRGWQY